MSRAQVHAGPIFNEINSLNIYKIVYSFILFFGSLPAMTLTFDLLNPISNQHICKPKYICEIPFIAFWDIVLIRFSVVTLTFDLLTLKSNQYICEPKYICD